MAVVTSACIPDPPARWPFRIAAVELLDGWRRGGRQFESALDRAAGLCRLVSARDAGDEERRELLAALVDELRGDPRPDRLWAGMLVHLASTPAPAATLY